MLPRYFEADPSLTNTATTYNGLQAAINAAVTAGASPTNRYVVVAGGADFFEAIEIFAGVHVRGQGRDATVLYDSLKIHSGGSLASVRVDTSAFTDRTYGVQFINDGAFRTGMRDVKVMAAASHAGIISGVELTGTNTGAFLETQGCYIYTKNSYTGSNGTGASKQVGVRVTSGYLAYGEFHGCHFKTSTGSGGTAIPTLVLCEAVAPSTNWGYAHIAFSDWEDVYGDYNNGSVTGAHPVLLQSSNTVHEGAMLDIGYQNTQRAGPPTVVMAYTGPYQDALYYERNGGGFRIWSHNYGYQQLQPTAVLNHTPTGGDLAVDGSVALVV